MNGPLSLGTGAAAVSSAPATSQAFGGAHAPGEGGFLALLQILGDAGKPMAPALALLDALDKPTLPWDAAQEADDALHPDAASLAGQADYPAGLGWMIFSMMQAPADTVMSPSSSLPTDALSQDPLSASLSNSLDGQARTAEKHLQHVACDEVPIPVDADLQALPDTQERLPAGVADSARGEAGQRALVSSEDGLPLLSAERSVFPLSERKDGDPSLITAAMARPSEPPSRRMSDAAPVFSLPRALHHPEWAGDVGERVMWMCQADVKSAHLRLDPPHLGEIEVRITLHDEGAEVWFSTPSAPVREALETALPRLRDLFTQHGLQLNQTGVSAEGGGRDSPAFTRPERPAALSRPVADLAASSVDLDLLRHGGLFEAYA
ncbi:MAG TPA: flagellar hook-length control protein FliK [Candidatus Macondimonas sp.]|nr:flagellar hook-length control protein FliK [Candidatus Macondimonas sp.]